MARLAEILARTAAAALTVEFAAAAPPDKASPPKSPAPMYQPQDRAVSTWRDEAAGHLVLTAAQTAALKGHGEAPRVARCVKLNNYWCIKKAGWEGELAADNEGHVAFASAREGAAVAALLLKRYYVDFNRKTAMAIVSHWAPAQCGGLVAGSTPARPLRTATRRLAPRGLGNTLRARWLAGHTRGFVTPVGGRKAAPVRRSVVADHATRPMPTPTIAVGLGEISRPTTLDALMMSNPNTPPSRSMIGMPRGGGRRRADLASAGSLSGCGYDAARIAAYAQKAVVGIAPGADGDLGLFDSDGKPTKNLSAMMTNMARVEIGPLGPTSGLIDAGIAAAFRPGRNPDKSSAATAAD